ncbi:MAG: riboflavin synthase [Bacilli bacterium]
MFTGIVEELGTIKRINASGQTLQLQISGQKVLEDVTVGDSIAVNGICLTVTAFTPQYFSVDVMPETFKSTSLAAVSVGSSVNLERAMRANSRFGGHIVSGHVDTVGKIIEKKAVQNAVYYTIAFDQQWSRYTIQKGSICVDGTSLTIFDQSPGSLTVSLIPHTQMSTVLGQKVVGNAVNLEFDTIAKYVERLLQVEPQKESKSSRIDETFLRTAGYLS